MLPSADTTFDYAALPTDKAASARAAAERIRGRLNAAFIETGRDLRAQKEALGHGPFLKWIDAEFNLGERSAQHLMNIAQLIDSNPNSRTDLEKLSQYTLRTLAAPSTPSEVRDEVLDRAANGKKVTAKEIESLRKKLDKLEDKLADKAAALSFKEARAAEAEKQRDSMQTQIEFLKSDKDHLAAELDDLRDEMERLREPGVITVNPIQQFNEAFVAPVSEPTPWTDDAAQAALLQYAWDKSPEGARRIFLEYIKEDLAA